MSKARIAGGVGAGALLAAIAVAGPFVTGWEERRLVPYRDLIGKMTVCDGETNVPMRTYTDAECEAMRDRSLYRYAVQIAPCMASEVPVKTRAAFVSFSYNVGVANFCRSTLSRKALAGDFAGACAELSKWNKARIRGELREVRGLTRRRDAEKKLCEEGLRDG